MQPSCNPDWMATAGPMPLQPGWALLSAALWRSVLLSVLPPSGEAQDWDIGHTWTQPPSDTTRRAWEHWWALMARVGSTCRLLRAALLGPEAMALWRFQHYQPPEYTQRQLMRLEARQPGLHELLVCQAHHAQRVVVEGGWPLVEQLQALFCQPDLGAGAHGLGL